MNELFIIADNELMKVERLTGDSIWALDAHGWGVKIPLTRVVRFCDNKGLHIDFDLNNL